MSDLPIASKVNIVQPNIPLAPFEGGKEMEIKKEDKGAPAVEKNTSKDEAKITKNEQGSANTNINLIDEQKDLPKSPKDEYRTLLFEIPYTTVVAINEAMGDKYRDSNGKEGWKTPYYNAQMSSNPNTKNVYWGLALGAGPILSYTAGNMINNAINGDPAFKNFSGIDMSRHVLFNVALEDCMYWAMMGKPVNDTWMRDVAGKSLGQTLGENSPIGIPFSYNMALGAALSEPLAYYRAENKGKQNIFGTGGKDPIMNALDAGARFSSASGMLIAAIPAFTGQPLPNGLRTAGAIALTGGVADGFATLQDGIKRGSTFGIIAGASSVASSFFQMSTFASYQGVNQQGMANNINARSVSIPALALGLISVGARVLDQ